MDKAMLIFNAVKLAIQIITEVMGAVEALLGPKTGKTKKEIALEMARGAVGDEIYAKFESVFSLFINLKAMLTFGSTGANPT